MDSMIFPALRFSNLNPQVPALQLAQELTQIFQEGQVNLRINVDQMSLYRNENKGYAVVRGIPLTFGRIKELLARKVLGGRDIVLCHDYNYARRPDGSFLQPLRGATKQLLDRLFMLPQHNIEGFFVEDLEREIRGRSYCNKITMDNMQHQGNFDLIRYGGRVLSVLNGEDEFQLFIEYFTLLEKLQALCFLNLNRDFALMGQFRNCIINRQEGLGFFGRLDVEAWIQNRGYIPFTAFDQALIHIPDITDKFRTCYKCNERGQIKLYGVTAGLKFFVGKCTVCDYSIDRDPLQLESAVRFKDEEFTRIVIERNDLHQYRDHEASALNLVHTPLKLVYSSPMEARNIICPIAQHESFVCGQLFTLANETRGVIVEPLRFIETINPEDPEEDQQCRYSIGFRLPRTTVWNPDNLHRFQHITVDFRWRDSSRPYDNFRDEIRRAKIKHMEELPDNQILIRCVMKMFLRCEIQGQDNYLIKPFAPNYEYEALRQTLTGFANHPNRRRFDFLKDIIMARARGFRCFPIFPLQSHPRLFVHDLNEVQASAVRRCQRARLTVVQGPPGTGKTHTAAVTVLEIARTEPALIICAAPSNEAADNICHAIQKMLQQGRNGFLYGGIEVCRMASMKKQFSFIRRIITEGTGAETDACDTNFRFLHEDIVSHELFFNDEKLSTLYERIETGGMDDLTMAESDLLDGHISDLGAACLSKMRIVVTTVASLNDGRIKEYLGDVLEDLDADEGRPLINTLLLDEAGVIPMPQAIPILAFRAKRFLLFGDQQQLPPKVTSYSAEFAGLTMSFMEYLQLAIVPRIPEIWRTLTIQYRMNPKISKLVSDMSYGGELECGPNIARRRNDPDIRRLRQQVRRAVPGSDMSDVVVFQHHHRETVDVSGSKYNTEEAGMVLELARRLVAQAVPQEKIVIITPYEAQRGRIAEQLQAQEATAMIRCVNVDAFQGREADIVILSFVRSNPRGAIGFCKNQNRLNVMVSRARLFQFYVGNMTMITASGQERSVDYHVRHIRESLALAPKRFLH